MVATIRAPQCAANSYKYGIHSSGNQLYLRVPSLLNSNCVQSAKAYELKLCDKNYNSYF